MEERSFMEHVHAASLLHDEQCMGCNEALPARSEIIYYDSKHFGGFYKNIQELEGFLNEWLDGLIHDDSLPEELPFIRDLERELGVVGAWN